jgi:hypothetical protein
MTKADSRSGSDLLRDVERKIDLLYRHVQNLDNNVKIMLGHLNELMNAPSDPWTPQIHAPAQAPESVQLGQDTDPQTYKFEDLPRTHKFEQMAAAQGIKVEPTNTEPRVKIVARPENPDDFDREELVEETVRKGHTRTTRTPKKDGGRIAVSQKVLYSNGSPVFLATVEILQRGKLIHQTRTKTNGRWAAPLDAGEYEVHVVKRAAPDSGKEPMDIRYPVEVPPSNENLEFPPPDVE